MKTDQIALILYTLRDYCQTGQDLRDTLSKVRDIGYTAVQVSGVSGEIPPEEIREALDANGLVCCATHEPGDRIRQQPESLIPRMITLGSTCTAYPFPAGVDFESAESVASLVADLSRAGRVLADAGITLCYHNHAHEFFRQGNKTILDAIYDGTDPSVLQAELDTFWVQAGGADPVAWIKKLSGRLPVIHLKDYGVRANGDKHFAPVGSGNLDWSAILPAAESAGCKWFIVEQDTCDGDPFEAVAESFRFLSQLTEG